MNLQNTGNLSKPYFENLNGLRTIGALSVFLFHAFLLGYEDWGSFYDGDVFQIIFQVMRKGNYGVNLFFVLSGFLITYLLLHEAATRGSINIRGFFMRRLLRIWPVYFVVIGFGFLLFPHLPYGLQTTNSGWMYSFFLSNFEEIYNGFRDPVNLLTITWSVSIEEQFYMGWVVLMAILPFLRKGKGFLPYLLLLVVISIVFRLFHIEDQITLYYHTLAVVSDLAIGGLLAYACFHYNWHEKFRAIPLWVNIGVYLATVGCILGSRILFPVSSIFLAFEKIVLGLLFAYIVFDQAFGTHSPFKADRIPFFNKLGQISYGMYMYHSIVLYFMLKLFVDLGWTTHIGYFVLYFILSLALTIAISAFSYRFMERPLLKLKRYF